MTVRVESNMDIWSMNLNEHILLKQHNTWSEFDIWQTSRWCSLWIYMNKSVWQEILFNNKCQIKYDRNHVLLFEIERKNLLQLIRTYFRLLYCTQALEMCENCSQIRFIHLSPIWAVTEDHSWVLSWQPSL